MDHVNNQDHRSKTTSCALVKSDTLLSVRDIADKLSVYYSAAYCTLEQVGKLGVSHELTEENMALSN